MLAQLRHVFLLCALLFCGWPAMLMAYAPIQPHPSLEPSSEPGFLLVAAKKLVDPWFRESVVLVTRMGNGGPFGIIVNHPGRLTVDQIFPSHAAAKDFNLFTGGPVNQKQISYIFRSEKGAKGALRLSRNIFLSYNPALLGELLSGALQHTGLRIMNGLAGWAPGQLENEIARGDWYVLPVDDKIIFDCPAAGIWPELLRKATATPNY